MMVFCAIHIFNIMSYHLLIFLSACAVSDLFRKSFHVPINPNAFPLSHLSYSGLYGPMLHSLSHLDLNFVWDDRYESICIILLWSPSLMDIICWRCFFSIVYHPLIMASLMVLKLKLCWLFCIFSCWLGMGPGSLLELYLHKLRFVVVFYDQKILQFLSSHKL